MAPKPRSHRAALIAAAALLLGPIRSAAGQPSGTIRGAVHDSLFRPGPLARAEVWLDRGSRIAVTDDSGRFAFPDVAPGSHRLTVFHPLLEHARLGRPTTAVEVTGPGIVEVALATPSGASIVRTVCPGLADAGGTVLGSDPSGATAVVATWEARVLPHAPRPTLTRTATAPLDSAGRFAFCGLPLDVDLAVRARSARSAGPDSVVVILTAAAPVAFVHLDGSAGPPGVADTGTVLGTVRTSSGRPVVGASITVVGTSRVAESSRTGGFAIDGLPVGRHGLRIRAVGLGERVMAVHVEPGTSRVAARLDSLAVVLPELVAEAPAGDANGFELRRRNGIGHFITEEDIARRRPAKLADMLATVPGVKVVTVASGSSVPRATIVVPRAQIGPAGLGKWANKTCPPRYYVDGVALALDNEADRPRGGIADPDDVLRIQDVRGIEVYIGIASVPPQYASWDSGCGVILIWTRTR